MMAPKFYNLFALMVMLLGLASAQVKTTSAVSSSAAAKATNAATSVTVSGTAKASTSASSTSKKSAGQKAADPTLVTISLAVGLVSFGLAMS